LDADIDIENEINKKRWERWRRKQNKKREKTYCYWGEVPSGCEDKDEDGLGNFIEILAEIYWSQRKIKVHWWSEMCHCVGHYAWAWPSGTVKIAISYDGSGTGPSETYNIDSCNGEGQKTFDVEARNGYCIDGYFDAGYKCCDPHGCNGVSVHRHASCCAFK